MFLKFRQCNYMYLTFLQISLLQNKTVYLYVRSAEHQTLCRILKRLSYHSSPSPSSVLLLCSICGDKGICVGFKFNNTHMNRALFSHIGDILTKPVLR